MPEQLCPDAVAFDAQVPADAVEEFGWRTASGRRRIFRDAGAVIGLRNNGKDAPAGDKCRLPPVVTSLFSIKAAHWGDAIRSMERGARGKGTARQRRSYRLTVLGYRVCRRAASAQGYGRARHGLPR